MNILRYCWSILDRLDGSHVDAAFRFELVRALYSTPNSIFSASIVALLIVGLVQFVSDDPMYFAFLAGFAAVGVWRTGFIIAFQRTKHDAENVAATKRWETRALLGAWGFATLVGLTGAYTLVAHPGTGMETLINCCVMGYIAGVSSRNASRPVITIGQISLTCVPFILGLLHLAEIVHAALAIFISVLFISTIVICRNVFDNIAARHYAYRKIENLARRDTLTQLWNRNAFLELLEQSLTEATRSNSCMSLIAIDLDRFKDVNDTLGHPAGDAVLREAALRIQSALAPGDEVSRIGGDEFLVLLSRTTPDATKEAAHRILGTFAAPFMLNGTSNSCSASAGYAFAPTDGESADVLLRNADLALYEAKKLGRNQAVAYASVFSEIYENKVALEHDLRSAIANHEFEVVYQPIVDPRSGRAICCEALLRWRHPTRGNIPPAVFIPIAEACGLIIPIGAWVLEQACSEATHWPVDITVSVNLSPVQIRQGHDIVDTVTAILQKTGLSPRRLELEVTESVLIEDTALALSVIEELRAAHIGISLDDFGTGFASLSYLNDFPFSKVKIDRKFSQNIDKSSRTAAIIKGVAQTTKDLRIELVAEGIETEGQLEQIRGLGINAIQGYLFSKPVSAAQLRDQIQGPFWKAPLFAMDGLQRKRAAG